MRPSVPPPARLLWAFDFDGVLCHSAKELCMTGPDPNILSSFATVRPVVETGWESMLINRALHEGEYSTETILKDYTASLREELIKEYGEYPSEAYMETFRSVRQEWMTSWGYNTADERRRASSQPALTVLDTEKNFLEYVQRRHRLT
ncbi:hypothetical protein NSK_005642 [Nannochloropsis salina CCMP1776]|uniref:Uncharacterized protein n=1 Tax=Nannochloropsis salina CCMP1776 TaxID=1027361 RepID=A0A4D9CWZ0_9STRA|nr:hypothetical protein NSK_005642 [Nannochloropsis salina CCMP1776]|eukprot:TFJ83054.1 hypothetical protein NSK_005642 [Nannochloropsis salina CCMP1776]